MVTRNINSQKFWEEERALMDLLLIKDGKLEREEMKSW